MTAPAGHPEPQTMIQMLVSLQYTGDGASRRTRFLILESDNPDARAIADAWLGVAKGPHAFTVVHDLRVTATKVDPPGASLAMTPPERPTSAIGYTPGFNPKAPEFGPLPDGEEGIVPGTTTGPAQ